MEGRTLPCFDQRDVIMEDGLKRCDVTRTLLTTDALTMRKGARSQAEMYISLLPARKWMGNKETVPPQQPHEKNTILPTP